MQQSRWFSFFKQPIHFDRSAQTDTQDITIDLGGYFYGLLSINAEAIPFGYHNLVIKIRNLNTGKIYQSKEHDISHLFGAEGNHDLFYNIGQLDESGNFTFEVELSPSSVSPLSPITIKLDKTETLSPSESKRVDLDLTAISHSSFTCTGLGGQCRYRWFPLIPDQSTYYNDIGRLDCSLLKTCFVPVTDCSLVGNCLSSSDCSSQSGESLGNLDCQIDNVCCRGLTDDGLPHISSITYQYYKEVSVEYFRFSLTGQNFSSDTQVYITELDQFFQPETTGRDFTHLSILVNHDTLTEIIKDNNLASLTFTLHSQDPDPSFLD